MPTLKSMNSAGVAAIVGGYASSICLAASQTAARYDLPYIVDVGVADSIVTRGLKNTFRFGPGFGVIAKTAIDNLVTLNDQAGKPAKTVMIVNEDSAFGSGSCQTPQRATARPRLSGARDHSASDADARLQQCRAQDQGTKSRSSLSPRTTITNMCCSRARCNSSACGRRRIYSVLGGAASSYKFVKEFPEAAQYIMDCNHWFDPHRRQGAGAEKDSSRTRDSSTPTKSI